MKILSFGEILLRLAAPGYTRLFQKDSLEATFCGGEANVAVSLAILGQDSEFLTVVPDNEVGRASINSLRYFGVDVSKVQYADGRMGLYYLEKGASQRPSKVIYDRKYSSIALVKKSDFNWSQILKDVNWFHWTGIIPALSDELPEICLKACRAAKDKGIIVSCDLNYRKTLWSTDKAQAVMKQLLPYVDVCIANEEDADKVLGIKAPDNDVESGILNKLSYEYVAKEICRQYGCKYVAITLRESYSASINGWSGMLYDAGEDQAYYSRKYDINLIDRVGGGDSFGAGIIYSLSNGMSSQEAIEFAIAASCLKQTIEGDYNRTSLEEINNLIKNGGNGRVQR